MNGYCAVCNKPLTTGDFNGICRECRENQKSEFIKICEEVSYVDKTVFDEVSERMKSIYDEAIECLDTVIVHDTIYGVYEGFIIVV